MAAVVKEAFKAFILDLALQRTVVQRTSYIGLTNLAAAGPGLLSGLRGGSFRTPLGWSGGMNPTSPVRVLRFCCTPLACLPFPVVRVSTWFWLSVTELSLALIIGRRRIPLEVAQDTVGKSRSVLDRA